MLFGDPVGWEQAKQFHEAVDALRVLVERQTAEILDLRSRLRELEGDRSRLVHELGLLKREREFLRETLKRIDATLSPSLLKPSGKTREKKGEAP